MSIKIARRGLLAGLMGLLPASLLPASETPKFRKWKHYKCPETALDAFMFIADHNGQVTRRFDAQAGRDHFKITMGEYWISWAIDCQSITPRPIEQYFYDYILPSCTAIWRHAYGEKK
jgi:hypothetical protein